MSRRHMFVVKAVFIVCQDGVCLLLRRRLSVAKAAFVVKALMSQMLDRRRFVTVFEILLVCMT